MKGERLMGSLFVVALKRRCRIRVQEEDAPCPACGGTMDSFGDHALVCPCRGDRTIRHNVIRDLVHREAVEAGLGAEKEKPGLLPPRPLEDGITGPPAGNQGVRSSRRPADIWLPRGLGHSANKPAAVDFGVTSGMKADKVARAAEGRGEGIPADYSRTKWDHLRTGGSCAREGFTFVPTIFEAHGGGWGVEARRVAGLIAHHQRIRGQWCPEGHAFKVAQRISVALHRENARAVLRRSEVPAPAGEEPCRMGGGALDGEEWVVEGEEDTWRAGRVGGA